MRRPCVTKETTTTNYFEDDVAIERLTAGMLGHSQPKEAWTHASIRAARAFLVGREAAPLHEVVDALMASRLGDKNWLLDHWSSERLFSVEARRGWIEPDLAPLPFYGARRVCA